MSEKLVELVTVVVRMVKLGKLIWLFIEKRKLM